MERKYMPGPKIENAGGNRKFNGRNCYLKKIHEIHGINQCHKPLK
jgi:hypothetical protein